VEILNFSPDQFKALILILMRISVVLYLFPIFGSSIFPPVTKAGLSLLLAMALFPVVRVDPGLFPESPVAFGIVMASELIIGLVLGMSVRFFLGAVELAGQMVGFQMGFAIINVLDPQSGTQVSIMAQLANLVIVLVFLLLNGHHAMIAALVESFDIVTIGKISLTGGLFDQILFLSREMFVLGVKIGAPAIVALLFTSAAFGITAKFAPQMNILIVAFPVKIVVGLLFFGLVLHIVLIVTRSYLSGFPALMTHLLKALGGG
jgi:flagellar biosynthetic protein FliR